MSASRSSASASASFCDDPLTFILWQRKNIQLLAALRDLDVECDRGRTVAGATATEPGHYRDVLLSIHAIGDRETLYRRSKPRFPQHLSGLYVEDMHAAVDIADQHPTASG